MPLHTEHPETEGGLRLLFGPQCSDLEDSIAYVNDSILKDPSGLRFLSDIVEELPSLWPAITNAWPALAELSGGQQLAALGRCVGVDRSPRSAVEFSSLVLTPVTVMRQLVDFWDLRNVASHPALPSSSSSSSSPSPSPPQSSSSPLSLSSFSSSSSLTTPPRIIDTQGFCVGILAAITVACSRDTRQFQEVAANALRLAVCIGALVDLDEIKSGQNASMAVRWESPADYEHLQSILSQYPDMYTSCYTDSNLMTLTLPHDHTQQFNQHLRGPGLRTKQISLRGRFHHHTHYNGIQHIMTLCNQDARFQLPRCDALMLPLRSNQDGEVIGNTGMLHTVALESILSAKANWWKTISALLDAEMKVDGSRFLTMGSEEVVPRSARSRCVKQDALVNKATPATSSVASSLPSGTHTPISRASSPEMPQIAITGMACRYPNANSVHELWDLLQLGQSTAQPAPESRFRMSELQREPRATFWGHFLDHPEVFDHRFFGISAREAESMDPQQRVLLQVAYEAMESAGYCGLQPAGSQEVGCYVGVGSEDYTENVASRNANAFSATGSLQSFIAGRISHYFGWSGPSITLDTACSSAAVAIHLACKALQTKECPIAVAGGVNILTNPRVYQNLAAASFLSPTGACKPFDASADGYCRGEGAGLVVLRPLQDAIDNGDPILGVIAGSAVNQGSNNSPITVPDSDSQRSLYYKALSLAGVTPDEVSYVEAHGTGTQVGDPIELESLSKAFGMPQRRLGLHVGSIKGNIGHTETSSGVAGLLKTILMLQKGRIPQQANFKQLNPKVNVPLDQYNITIPKQSTEWASPRRIAMVNNYGASGNNAALVVKDHATADALPQGETPPVYLQDVPVVICARSEESIRAYCGALRSSSLLSSPQSVCDLAYNLAIKQNRSLAFNLTFSSSLDPASLAARLEGIAAGTSADIIQKRPASEPPVVLCFGGQNGVTATISKELFDGCSLLQTYLLECEEAGQTLGLPSLFPKIFSATPISDTVHLHFALFSIQYACAKAWIDSGLRVDRIIGHSFGQLTALAVAGSLSLHDGIRLVTGRARLIQTNWGPDSGLMLAVKGPEAVVHRLLEQTGHAADIACYNGPEQLVVAGSDVSIREIEKTVASSGSAHNVRLTRLENSHAFHSRLVDSIVSGLTELAESLVYRTPSIPIEACSANGDWAAITPAKIVEHSRMPVYFQRAVERTAGQLNAPAVWLEAGSASPIIPMVRRALENSSSASHAYHKLDLGGPRAASNLAAVTSGLWAQGIPVQFWPFHRSQRGAFSWINLPPYQFAKNSHWVDFDPAAFAPVSTAEPQAVQEQFGLLRQLRNGPEEYLFAVNTQDALYRSATMGHAVLHQSLCPASMYVEMVLRATGSLSEAGETVMSHVEDLTISSPLVLDPQGGLFLRLGPASSRAWSFAIFTGNEAGSELSTHAKGTVYLCQERSRTLARFNSMGRLIDPARGKVIEEDMASSGLRGATVYAALHRVTDYADYFRGVKQVFANGREAAGVVSMPASTNETDTACNPILFDCFLQVAGLHVNCLSGRKEEEVFVCNAIGDTFIGEPLVKKEQALPSSWKVYTSYSPLSKTEVVCDIYVMDGQTGSLAAAMIGVVFTSVSIRSLGRVLAKLNNNPAQDVDPAPVQDQPKSDQVKEPVEDTTAPVAGSSSNADGSLVAVQAMLGDLFGVGPEELSPSVSLLDIGVDSLMSTEVLAEIKKRFQVDMAYSTLVDIPDIQGLVQHIFAGRGPVAQSQPVVEAKPQQQPVAPQTAPAPPVTVGDGPSLISVAQRCFEETRTVVSPTQDAHWAGFFHTVYPQQVTLIAAYILEAFRALGSPLESLRSDEVVPTISVQPRHEQLREHLYRILESVHLIRRAPTGKLVRTSTPLPSLPSHALHANIRDEHSSYALEHDLLQITGPRLADCLTGQADGVSLIFQNAQTRSLVGDVYTNSPVFKSGNLSLVRYLTHLVQSLGNSRPIKILEIGAGTGGTTSFVLEQLSALPGSPPIEYTFTDISPSLVAGARRKFANYDFVRYETLDVENGPAASLHGQYDIVLSTNCVHATRNLVESCSNIRALLKPDGIVCLVELTRDIFWLDLVFGLLEGWWRFGDGRQHALASEGLWDRTLRKAGFEWVDWTDNEAVESNALRVVVASPSSVPASVSAISKPAKKETLVWADRDGLPLLADVFYPDQIDTERKPRPIALMIHGGGHVMLSRHDIRPAQTQTLLDAGFLPISIDYRLCPEVSLANGPMADARDALAWARCILPSLPLLRPDIRPDGTQVVAIGWSTGGHLAMTLPFTAPAAGVAAPDAVLAFYCPTNYEDPFWSSPNYPFGQTVASNDMEYDVWEGVRGGPIAGYNPSLKERPLGGWMTVRDPRSRIALHMNWAGQTLPVLLKGWMHKDSHQVGGNSKSSGDFDLPRPTEEEVQAVSPHYQIRAGTYRTPTFLIHGTSDDLVPCGQSQSTYSALVENGVEAEMRVVEKGVHLFDLYPSSHAGQEATRAVEDGYEFLKRHVRA